MSINAIKVDQSSIKVFKDSITGTNTALFVIGYYEIAE